MFAQYFSGACPSIRPWLAKPWVAVVVALALSSPLPSFAAPSPFLCARGTNICNDFGQGDVVAMHGVNLGSWLLMEGWMCPMDSSGFQDNYSVLQTLDHRFGVAAEQALLKTYQANWITTNDLDNIKALGMNYVRLPFWWANVETLDGTWRADAFDQLDWLVTNAWKRGLYTLIDLHGVPGGQSTSQDTGQENRNQYWSNPVLQNQTAEIWTRVAAHYRDNPAVMGYDLMNEPIGAPTQAALWAAYDRLYRTVRAVDPAHIVLMEGAWHGTGMDGRTLNWQWDVLPPPAQFGWTNVVYEMHAYPGGGGSAANEVNKQVNDFQSHLAWNVPALIGEFNWEDNTPSDWKYGTQQFNQNNLSWAHWSYKATAGAMPNSWGIYDPFGNWPPVPNIRNDSWSTISNDWAQWQTGTAFEATPFLRYYLGTPPVGANIYTNLENANANALPELDTAEEIRRLPPEQAERHYAAHLRGVITFFDQKIPTKAYRFIQDDTGGIYFYLDPAIANESLKPGQAVEIDGQTGQGEFAPVLVAHRIKILGDQKLPQARPASFDALTSGQEDSQFVETHGIIHSVRLDPETSDYILDIATGGEHVSVYTSHIPAKSGDDLVDTSVRVRGICITHFNQQRQLFDVGLLVPELEDIKIEKNAPADPFSQPAQSIKNILQFKWGNDYGHRVKVTGNVTLAYADKLYIQDETGGMSVQTTEAGDFNVGDQVEVLGFPAKGDYTPMLQSATCRKLPVAIVVRPETITVDEALKGTHDCRLVSLEATLLDRAQQSNESFLILQAGKFVFHAYLKWPKQNLNLASLINGSKVMVTGICVVDPGNNWYSGSDWRAQSFSLLPRSLNDIQLLARPPWWNLQRLLVAMGVLCATILAAMSWVFLLRRRVHAQTKIIEEKLQAEAAIKARYVELFENANDVVFTHDLEGRMTSINKTGALLLQRQREDILDKHFTELIVEEQRPAAQQWLEQVVAGTEPPTADLDFIGSAGQRLTLEINSRKIEQAGQFIEVESIARDATERKRLEREILEVVNKEQKRLGHDLHDGVCQQLAAIAYRAHILARRLKDREEADSSEAQDISKLINDSLLQTRAVARGLFPVRLEAEGLVSALEEFASSTSGIYHIKCAFTAAGNIAEFSNVLAMHAYYIAQEAVMNAIKHGHATEVEVNLSQAGENVLLTIQDNGIGFRPADCKPGGMGIGIMRYRAKVIGATLELKSEPGQGTKITCKIRPTRG
jgi:PAS domain S-box-containing protein